MSLANLSIRERFARLPRAAWSLLFAYIVCSICLHTLERSMFIPFLRTLVVCDERTFEGNAEYKDDTSSASSDHTSLSTSVNKKGKEIQQKIETSAANAVSNAADSDKVMAKKVDVEGLRRKLISEEGGKASSQSSGSSESAASSSSSMVEKTKSSKSDSLDQDQILLEKVRPEGRAPEAAAESSDTIGVIEKDSNAGMFFQEAMTHNNVTNFKVNLVPDSPSTSSSTAFIQESMAGIQETGTGSTSLSSEKSKHLGDQAELDILAAGTTGTTDGSSGLNTETNVEHEAGTSVSDPLLGPPSSTVKRRSKEVIVESDSYHSHSFGGSSLTGFNGNLYGLLGSGFSMSTVLSGGTSTLSNLFIGPRGSSFYESSAGNTPVGGSSSGKSKPPKFSGSLYCKNLHFTVEDAQSQAGSLDCLRILFHGFSLPVLGALGDSKGRKLLMDVSAGGYIAYMGIMFIASHMATSGHVLHDAKKNMIKKNSEEHEELRKSSFQSSSDSEDSRSGAGTAHDSEWLRKHKELHGEAHPDDETHFKWMYDLLGLCFVPMMGFHRMLKGAGFSDTFLLWLLIYGGVILHG